MILYKRMYKAVFNEPVTIPLLLTSWQHLKFGPTYTLKRACLLRCLSFLVKVFNASMWPINAKLTSWLLLAHKNFRSMVIDFLSFRRMNKKLVIRHPRPLSLTNIWDKSAVFPKPHNLLWWYQFQPFFDSIISNSVTTKIHLTKDSLPSHNRVKNQPKQNF